MTTAQQIPAELRKIAVYDSEGNILLKESLARLEAQLGGTGSIVAGEVKKSKARFADTTAKPVRDTTTGEEWPSQAKMAREVRPGTMVKDGSHKNNLECYNIYKDFPGRYEKLVNGAWVVQNPVKPVETVPATTSDAPASPLA